jgi:hypothetical protein
MKKILPLLLAAALGMTACQKQPTKTKRNAQIERQVQQRFRAEERQKLVQRQAELERSITALAAKQKLAAAAATPTVSGSSSTPVSSSGPDAGSDSYSVFYRKLDPYGDWMETRDYGYVFQPRQAAQSRDWRPYTNGHWIYTDAGWTWISDEKFGWATYHYGRWIRLRDIGWVWVPGEQWAPAWVSWRKGGDYVGWAPLPPEAQFDRQIGIHNWADNYYDIGPGQYTFVPANEFGRKLTPREIVPTDRNVTIINQTTNVTNIVYNNSVIIDRGPSYEDLRAHSRQPIERYRLERTTEPNNEAPIFRGEVVALPTSDFHPAERAARPNRVVRTIAQPVVEHGWSGVENTQAAQETRAKMQAEATPPLNLPPRQFVRQKPKNAAPPRAVPTTPGQIVSPTVSAATAIPIGTPAPLPSNPPPAPPSATASASPRPSPTAPAENVSSPKQTQRETARATQEQKRKQRQAERQQTMKERRGQRPRGAPAAPTPTTSASAAGTTPSSASPTPATLDKETAATQRRIKRAEKRARNEQANPETTPEPDASPQ